MKTTSLQMEERVVVEAVAVAELQVLETLENHKMRNLLRYPQRYLPGANRGKETGGRETVDVHLLILQNSERFIERTDLREMARAGMGSVGLMTRLNVRQLSPKTKQTCGRRPRRRRWRRCRGP